jgi:hypothetical protein
LIRSITKLEEGEKWLLNSARSANKPTPVASAITTTKVNAPRRLALMRLLKQPTSHQKTRKMEVRYDPEQVSAPYDKGVRHGVDLVLFRAEAVKWPVPSATDWLVAHIPSLWRGQAFLLLGRSVPSVCRHSRELSRLSSYGFSSPGDGASNIPTPIPRRIPAAKLIA